MTANDSEGTWHLGLLPSSNKVVNLTAIVHSRAAVVSRLYGAAVQVKLIGQRKP